MFKKVLIANRGEIACRIIHTLKKMHITSVAIYNEADRNALHSMMADEAYFVGPNDLSQSYLDIDKILNIAQEANSDAIHPGYGFLSENCEFSKRCKKAGIVFIGPSEQAILQMGEKDKAKALMEKAKVPVVPGYYGDKQSTAHLILEVKKIGLPVMIKAACGGGGKGMRIVHEENEIEAAIESAKREAQKSFGDNKLLIEKYIENARHIEVQIFGDTHGNYVHLFERDCSVQRRHQKIIEEAPGFDIPQKVKDKMYQAAINAAKAIDYVNAGTIEFLYDGKSDFYFMEMNTRLQVEHPVTEAITGLDLVEWQCEVAMGNPLPLNQSEITQTGWAIEARVYAEDPFKSFLPAIGQIKHIVLPQVQGVRIDSGIQAHDDISIHFDPLLAKVIVHAKSRELAITKLKNVLCQYEILGVTTNLAFLREICGFEDYIKGHIHTHYVTAHLDKILENIKQKHLQFIGPAVLAYLMHTKSLIHRPSAEPNSPWHQQNAWALNAPFIQHLSFKIPEDILDIHVQHMDDQIFITSKHLNTPMSMKGQLENGRLSYEQNGQRYHCLVQFFDDKLAIFQNGFTEIYQPIEFEASLESEKFDPDNLTAPMPGVITNIWVKPGTKVNKGEKLLALEAMKMEHTVSAITDGMVKDIFYQVGDQVDEGAQIVEFKSDES